MLVDDHDARPALQPFDQRGVEGGGGVRADLRDLRVGQRRELLVHRKLGQFVVVQHVARVLAGAHLGTTGDRAIADEGDLGQAPLVEDVGHDHDARACIRELAGAVDHLAGMRPHLVAHHGGVGGVGRRASGAIDPPQDPGRLAHVLRATIHHHERVDGPALPRGIDEEAGAGVAERLPPLAPAQPQEIGRGGDVLDRRQHLPRAGVGGGVVGAGSDLGHELMGLGVAGLRAAEPGLAGDRVPERGAPAAVRVAIGIAEAPIAALGQLPVEQRVRIDVLAAVHHLVAEQHQPREVVRGCGDGHGQGGGAGHHRGAEGAVEHGAVSGVRLGFLSVYAVSSEDPVTGTFDNLGASRPAPGRGGPLA